MESERPVATQLADARYEHEAAFLAWLMEDTDETKARWQLSVRRLRGARQRV